MIKEYKGLIYQGKQCADFEEVLTYALEQDAPEAILWVADESYARHKFDAVKIEGVVPVALAQHFIDMIARYNRYRNW